MRKILVLFFIFLLTGLINAQVLIEAVATVDKDKVNLGDVVRYSIVIKRSGAISQSPMVTPPSFDGFRVTGSYSQNNISIINGNATLTAELIYDLIAVKSGEIIIDPAEIKFINPSTGAQEVIKTKPVKVIVGTGKRKGQLFLNQETPTPLPTSTPEEDIREIKTKLEFRFSNIIPFLMLGLLFLIILIIAAYLIFRKPSPKNIVIEDVDYKKEAIKKLIKAKELLKKDDIKGYYYEVYEIVRFYMEAILKDSFKELTTREIVYKLKEKKLLKDDKIKTINEFLQELDLVKFTEYKPDDKEVESIEFKAKEIIENLI